MCVGTVERGHAQITSHARGEGEGGLADCDSSNKNFFFAWDLCDMGGGGGLKNSKIVWRNLCTAPK